MMKVFLAIAATCLILPVPASAQQQVGTIDRGEYVCELPGDAGGAAGIHQPDEDFEIESASRYSSPQGSGTYLRRGNRLTLTSGPRNGDRYVIISRGILRKLAGGEATRLRCIREVR